MKLNVTAKTEKFRRAGFEFCKTAKQVDVDEKTAAILKAEPMLVVEEMKESGNAGGAPAGKQYEFNAPDTIERIQKAKTLDALDALVKDDERKGVIAAAEKRRAELAPKE